jgi:hypothetical protein
MDPLRRTPRPLGRAGGVRGVRRCLLGAAAHSGQRDEFILGNGNAVNPERAEQVRKLFGLDRSYEQAGVLFVATSFDDWRGSGHHRVRRRPSSTTQVHVTEMHLFWSMDEPAIEHS